GDALSPWRLPFVRTHPSPLPDRPPAAPVDHRSLLDGLGDACLALQPDGRVSYCNPACGDLLGVAPDVLTGRPLAAVLPGFAGSLAARACGRALATGATHEARQAYGERVYHFRASPAAGGAVVLIADVTGLDRPQHGGERTPQAQKLESLGLLAAGLA